MYTVLGQQRCCHISSLSLFIFHSRMCTFSLWFVVYSISLINKLKCSNASSAFNAHALGALAEVAGPGLDFHLSTILPALLAAMGDADEV